MDHGDNEQPPIFLYRDDHQSLIVLITISIDVHIERLVLMFIPNKDSHLFYSNPKIIGVPEGFPFKMMVLR